MVVHNDVMVTGVATRISSLRSIRDSGAISELVTWLHQADETRTGGQTQQEGNSIIGRIDRKSCEGEYLSINEYL